MEKEVDSVISKLRSLGNESDRQGMSRFGISIEMAFGIRMPVIRELAKEIKKNHELALELWKTGYHEAKILAALLLDPKKLTIEEMESWLPEFDSWDVCDQCCMGTFRKHPRAFELAIKWSKREPEFEKRAGFAMMASLAVHAKKAKNEEFEPFFERIISEAGDGRNFVKKAINWALRQIGKRNSVLCERGIEISQELMKWDEKSAVWVGKDAFRELMDRKKKDNF